ncbi:ATP-dependent DNA helicase PIF1 [Abortiporus biennis]
MTRRPSTPSYIPYMLSSSKPISQMDIATAMQISPKLGNSNVNVDLILIASLGYVYTLEMGFARTGPDFLQLQETSTCFEQILSRAQRWHCSALCIVQFCPSRMIYAVRIGREGPKIYDSWEEAEQNVVLFPHAMYKSFPLSQRQEAETWINISFHPQPTHNPSQIQHPNQSQASVPSSSAASTSTSTLYEEDAMDPEDEREFIRIYYEDITAAQDLHDHTFFNTPPLAHAPLQDVKLSKEQYDVLNMVRSGRSVFFTGSAGTGKSVLLRKIIEDCKEKHIEFAVTASTGIAAVNVGGCTLHSWAGIGLGKEDKEDLVRNFIGEDKWEKEKKARKSAEMEGFLYDENPYSSYWRGGTAMRRWIETQILIIDEISMIDGILFDKLDFIARALRRNNDPFGGIQLVLCGDFLQLPPVPDKHTETEIPQPQVFAFEALSWNICVGRPVFLSKVFRQKDQGFVDMLNEMRFGHVSAATILKFKALERPVKYNDGIEPTDLFPTRNEVDQANYSRLASLNHPEICYKANDVAGWTERGRPIGKQAMDRLLSRLVAQKEIRLKIGAQVMLIKNLVQGRLVNGSVGVIIGFCTCAEAVREGTQVAQFEIDPPFERDNKNKNNFNNKPRVPERFLSSQVAYPKVRFAKGDTILCIPTFFEVNNANLTLAAKREQVPLILAWALSIHKSQGQTLERVRVNLKKTFEKGQAYVALSRATSMDTLQILDFDPARIMAHERVLAWMREHCGDIGTDVDADLEFWNDLGS